MAGTYKPADLPDSDEELEKRPDGTPDTDLAEAAAYVCGLLEAAEIGYAIIGGFGMKIRGSDRPTQDVDIAIEAGTSIQKIQAAVGGSDRVRLPNLPNAVYRILVRVSSGAEVQVDLKLATHAGAPASLQGLREKRTFRGRNFTVLTPFAAFCSKLKVHAGREQDTDLQDLEYLLQRFGDAILARIGEVSRSDLSIFLEKLDEDARKKVMQFLRLG